MKTATSGPGAKPSRSSGIAKLASRAARRTSQQLASASAAADAGALHGRDGRPVHRVDQAADLGDAAARAAVALAERRAGREVLAGTAQHDDAHGVIAAVPLEAVRQRVQHRVVVAVGLVGPVERDGGDAADRDRREQRVHGVHPAASGTGSVSAEKRSTCMISLPYFAASATARL